MGNDPNTIGRHSFRKKERICSQKQIDSLFNGGQSKTMTVFPIRMVYAFVEKKEHEPWAKLLVSVPKKHLKKAVDRNLVKRQLREAYRQNKHLVIQKLEQQQQHQMLISLIWSDSQLQESRQVAQKVISLLQRVSEKI